ncbi:MAG: cyclic nucleotide-binding domain-containing protein [Pseudomonadota bacterium]|nr:cyclic nucleotide-binding domain-containing protein [Pseudomonadota bacterium]
MDEHMDEQALFELLPELVEQLGIDHVKPLLDRISVHALEAGRIMVHDQEPIDAFFLVLSGRLQLAIELSGHTIQLGDIRPGNWCGELGYFSGVRRASSTVTVGEGTTVARLSYADFDALIAEDSIAVCRLTHAFIQMLIRRLQVTANNPVIDPEGNMLLLGDLTVPLSELSRKSHGVVDFLKSLLGARG